MTNFEDFILTARALTGDMLDIIQKSYSNYLFSNKGQLEKLDKIRAIVRYMELNPVYHFKNKKQQKEYKRILKQLKVGCDKLEKAIMEGNVLLIF